MTLLSHQIEAGWREVTEGARWAAEKVISLPGATASTVRVEAESSGGLLRAVSLREGQLAGRLETPKDVVTNDGSAVTDGQHEALKTAGVAVVSEDVKATYDETLASKDAEIAALQSQLAGVQAALDAAPKAEDVAAKDKEIEDLKSTVDAANEALANAQKAPDSPPEIAVADPAPASDEEAPAESPDETAPSTVAVQVSEGVSDTTTQA